MIARSAGGRLASVAVPFYLGKRYTDIGVVAAPEFREDRLHAVRTPVPAG